MNTMTLRRAAFLLIALFALSALLLACRPREEQPATTTAPATTGTAAGTEAATTPAVAADTTLSGPVTQQAQQTGPSAAPGQPATTPTEQGGPQPFDPATTPTAPEEIAATPTETVTPDTEPATEPVATQPAATEPATTEPAATEPTAEPTTEPAAAEPAAAEPTAESTAEPATAPAAAPADAQAGEVTVTLDNVGATAWTVVASEGGQTVAEAGQQNPTLTLTVGTRYTFINQGSPTHPLDFRDAGGNFLLAQSGQGSFEADANVAWQDDTGSLSFTLTPELAEALSSYHCSVHPGMQGAISITQ